MRPFPYGTTRTLRPARTSRTPPEGGAVPAGQPVPTASRAGTHAVVPGYAHTAAGRRHPRDRGASSIEFAGMLPLLLLVALAAIQLGLAGYAVQQAGTGARAAARTASDEDLADQCAGSGKSAMSDWTANRASFDCGRGEDEATATATVTIPSVIPGIDGFGDASRTVTMPSE